VVPDRPSGMSAGPLSPISPWPAPPASLRAAHDQVHVWRISFDTLGAVPIGRLRETLSAEERARADRLVRGGDDYTIGRGALRDILGRYLHQPSRAVTFGYGARGKPHLAGMQCLSFNLSHSGRYALLAVGGNGEVGIDLERIRDDVDRAGLAARCFTLGERRLLGHPTDAAHAQRFFQIWTRKEAYIKAVGAGLSKGLDLFECVEEPAEGTWRVRETGGPTTSWLVNDLQPAPAYVGALAYRGAVKALRFWEWRLPH